MDPQYKQLYSTIAELAAHGANTFYTCSTCSEKVYTFIENDKRICFQCNFDYSEPNYRCGGCLLGCYACKN